MSRSPRFTLGETLARLGHDCPGACPAVACDRRATVWFRHQKGTTGSAAPGIRTIVDVEFASCAWSASYVRRLVRDINQCTGRDAIQVRAPALDHVSGQDRRITRTARPAREAHSRLGPTVIARLGTSG